MDDQSWRSGSASTTAPISVVILEGVEVVFDQSGLNRSSREQPDRTFPCRYAGCNVACKRTYERNRHEQTRHKQSKNLFCPIGRCRCSRDADELAEALSHASFYSWKGPADVWASQQDRMKAETLEHRSNDPNRTGEYSKVRLLGFARRDKVISHIKKAHKEINTTADDFSIERDALAGEPVVAELQAFWGQPYHPGYWTDVCLGRLQRTDGSWTSWFGHYRACIEAAGFQPWTELGERDYKLLRKEEGYKDVLPWEASGIMQQRNITAAQESGERTNMQTLNLQQDASLNHASGDPTESSMQPCSTSESGPEGLTTPYADLLVGYENGVPVSHPLAHATDLVHVSLPPAHIGGSLSTGSAPLTPIYHSGETLYSNNVTMPMAASAVLASGAAQDYSPLPGNLDHSNLLPALPTLPWADSASGVDAVAGGEINFDFGQFDWLQQWQRDGTGEQSVGEPGVELGDEFNYDFGDFLELPVRQPEGNGEHGEDEPKDEAGDYSGLGKRRFSQL